MHHVDAVGVDLMSAVFAVPVRDVLYGIGPVQPLAITEYEAALLLSAVR